MSGAGSETVQRKPARRMPSQLSAVNQWLDDAHGTSLPPELLLVIKEYISDWASSALPNPEHRRDATDTTHDVPRARVSVDRYTPDYRTRLCAVVPQRPYFEIHRDNMSKIQCVRQEFEPAHCEGAQSFDPGYMYHVQLRMTSGKAVAGHQQMQLIGTADGPHGAAPDGKPQDLVSFSCSTVAFPHHKASKEGSQVVVDILIDLPKNSDRPLLKRLQVGTVSVRGEGGHRQLMVKGPFLPLTLYAMVLCASENCTECGVRTTIEVLSSETVTKEEFKQLQATQVERVPQK